MMKAKTTQPLNELTEDKPRADKSGKRRDVEVADAVSNDLTDIIDLDARITGFARAEFWKDLFRQRATSDTLCVLVATSSGKMIGYALGEVRSWPVRAPACGWLYAIGVDKNYRLHKCASALMAALVSRFKQSGVSAIRTMIEVDDHLLMSFLRSCGMTAGPFVELEMTLPAGE